MAQRMEPYTEAEMIALEQEMESEKMLHCEECGEPIIDGYYLPQYDAALCKECMERFRI